MAEIYVVDNIPFGYPEFRTHEQLGELCIGSIERMGYINAPRSEWTVTGTSLRELAAGFPPSVTTSTRRIAENLYLGCEIIGEKLPAENPELRIVLKALGQALDAEQKLRELVPQVEDLKSKEKAATKTMLSHRIRGVSLTDIDKAREDRTK